MGFGATQPASHESRSAGAGDDSRAREGKSASTGECERLPETPDELRTDRQARFEAQLLEGDHARERLEDLRIVRWAHAAQRMRGIAQQGIGFGEPLRAARVHVEAEYGSR